MNTIVGLSRVVQFCLGVLTFVVVMNTEAVTLCSGIGSCTTDILVQPSLYTGSVSTGADGIFQPASSVILDATRLIFNFSSIYIPSGVAVSFSDQLTPQTYTFLASGNVYIAGTLDMGINNLRIETPGTISLLGSIITSGGTLALLANSINYSDSLNTPGLIGPILNSSPAIVSPGAGELILSPVPEPKVWGLLIIGLSFAYFVYRRRILA